MKRGRPKYDDVLTPREWGVLELVRYGLTNEEIAQRLGISEEIAQRLGISLDTAKFHVSEILTKLGVETRQEAARWPGRPKRTLGGWWPFGGIPRLTTAQPWRAAFALAVGVVVIAVLAVGLLVSSSGDVAVQEPAPAAGIDGDVLATAGTQASTPLELPVVVCFNDDTWQKPSREQQERYMTTDYRLPRYGTGPGLAGRAGEAFDAHFWGYGFSASGMFSMTDMSGLWTARDAGIDLRNVWSGPCEPSPLMAAAQINLWLLGYEARGASLDGSGHLTVRVSPKQAGFQAVQLRVDGVSGCCPAKAIEFVNQSGVHIETMDQIWSKP